MNRPSAVSEVVSSQSQSAFSPRTISPRTVRRIVYTFLFLAISAVGSFALLNGAAFATTPEQVSGAGDTIPPNGGTIPVSGAGVRLLHLAPFGQDSTVSVVLSGTQSMHQFTELSLGDSTGGYVNFKSGSLKVTVTPIGSTTPLFVRTVELANRANYTLAIVGGANGLVTDLLALRDISTLPQPLFGSVRFVNAAPTLPGIIPGTFISVLRTDALRASAEEPAHPEWASLEYSSASPYVTLPAREYDWSVKFGGIQKIVNIPAFDLNSEGVITIFAIGDDKIQTATTLMVIERAGEPVRYTYMPFIGQDTSPEQAQPAQ